MATNDSREPYPIYREENRHKVISMFEGEAPHHDVMCFLERFVAKTKELQGEFDVIIITPSSNKLNGEISKIVSGLIRHSDEIECYFTKLEANDVYEYWLYTNWFDKHPEVQHSTLLQAIISMNKYNNGVFSYKFIKPIELRNAIKNSMKVSNVIADYLSMGDYINGKNVLVIDDTIASGKTISDSANAILEMYEPQSITFLTLFSPLK